MNPRSQRHPICDLHCDLLAYLAKQPNGHPANTEDIGCAIPHLRDGGVKLQVMAVYTAPGDDSVALAQRQVSLFAQLLREHAQAFASATTLEHAKRHLTGTQTGIVLSVESGSGLCTESEPLDEGLARLDQIEAASERVIYVSLTHHGENRFGGGNACTVGLKADGRVLLDYVNGRGIAVDLSHASDALAGDILNHLEAGGLDVPVLASHSNFRAVREHARNLTDEIAREVIRRKGLIGLNFLREFLAPDNPEALAAHVEHGLALGAEEVLCFGADFFHTGSHPDKSREPFYFAQHENALCYQPILTELGKCLTEANIKRLAFENVMTFLERNWTGPA